MFKIRHSNILKIKRYFKMIIFIILLFLFSIFVFYSTYISCLYVLSILKCEPRDFPWNGFLISTISIIGLLYIIPYKKYAILFFLSLSVIIWISHFASYLKRIIKGENIYPFTPEFHIHFLISAIIHVLLVVAILRI